MRKAVGENTSEGAALRVKRRQQLVESVRKRAVPRCICSVRDCHAYFESGNTFVGSKPARSAPRSYSPRSAQRYLPPQAVRATTDDLHCIIVSSLLPGRYAFRPASELMDLARGATSSFRALPRDHVQEAFFGKARLTTPI